VGCGGEGGLISWDIYFNQILWGTLNNWCGLYTIIKAHLYPISFDTPGHSKLYSIQTIWMQWSDDTTPRYGLPFARPLRLAMPCVRYWPYRGVVSSDHCIQLVYFVFNSTDCNHWNMATSNYIDAREIIRFEVMTSCSDFCNGSFMFSYAFLLFQPVF